MFRVNNDYQSEEEPGCFYIVSSLEKTETGTTFKEKNKIYYTTDNSLKYGDYICINNYEINEISNKYQNKSSFNYVRYMQTKGVKYKVTIKNLAVKKRRNGLYERLMNYRNAKISQNDNLTNALVYGENDFDQQEKDQLATGGVAHLFAISGMHVSILILILEGGLKKIKVPKKLIKVLLGMTLIIYLPIVGFAIGAVRACLMYLGKLIGFKDNLFCWFLVIDLLILIDPYLLNNIGFELTFGLTLIFILLNKFKVKMTFWKLSFLLYATSLIFTINLQNSLSLQAPIQTIILTPIIMLIYIIALLNQVLNWELLNELINKIYELLQTYLIWTNKITIPISDLISYEQLIYIIVISWLLIDLFKTGIIKRKIFLLVISFFLYLLIKPRFINTMHIVDINQGDAIVIKLKTGENILIDTGSEKHYRELKDYLKSAGIRRLDTVILSHNHEDHVGNLKGLVKDFKVKKIYYPLIDFAKSELPSKIEKIGLVCDQTLKIRNYQFKILNPCLINDSNHNNNSLVIQLKTKDKIFLLAGDLEEKKEKELIKKYKTTLKSTDLKVGHHGSKTSTSTEFLKFVKPERAYISVGKNNNYNHPARSIVTRLEQRADVYQTKNDGEIIIRFE